VTLIKKGIKLKLRQGFISNSSTSSFLVTLTNNLDRSSVSNLDLIEENLEDILENIKYYESIEEKNIISHKLYQLAEKMVGPHETYNLYIKMGWQQDIIPLKDSEVINNQLEIRRIF